MKRQAVLLALIVSTIASPLGETPTKSQKKEIVATTTERGIGTGVTEKIAPSAAPPAACKLVYNGEFGIAVMNITTAGKAVAPPAPPPVPVPSQVKPAVAPAETTPPPAAGPPDQFGALTKQTTRTHTKTVTVRRTVIGQKPAVAASVYMISQIGDGQIQAPTAHTVLSYATQGAAPPKAGSTIAPVSEIGDGQIQAPGPKPAAASPKPAAAPPAAPKPAAAPPAAAPPAVDPMAGMNMSPAPAPAPKPAAPAAAPAAAPPAAFPGLEAPKPAGDMSGMAGMAGMPMSKRQNADSGMQLVACQTPGTLTMTLQDGVLKDNKGRTGYIASNYQFQFDAPPQSGSIYTAGFSVCNNGSLALGGSNVWYQCRSGDFYNLYDRWWAPQCNAVTINAVMLKKC